MTKSSPDHIEQRYENLREIEQSGADLYPHRFELSHSVADLVSLYEPLEAEELEKQEVAVRSAGRLIAIRGHGKASFGHLQAAGEKIQIYVRQDRVGEENYRLYKALDLGDIIGVEGVMARTRTGELTIFVDQVTFLSKALLPLPEKWHGLADVETRYRQRYLDLIANLEVRDVFVKRARCISEIRRFMEDRGYLEVETPMMQTMAGGAVARPFETFHEALGIPLFLRIAPELYLKRLVVGGFDRVYEINRNFRNEGISTQHNPEFTMLEFYQAYSDYGDLMDLTEEMLQEIVPAVAGSLQVPFRGETIDFGSIRRLSMMESIEECWEGNRSVSLEDLNDEATLLEILREKEVDPGEEKSWGELLGWVFEEVVEEKLIQPTLIYDFPVELSPLAKKKDKDPRLVERFELFAGGLELANAYSELNDPHEQERRFEEQLRQRQEGDLEAHGMDRDYIRALKHGMPPTAGEGIGIDRLVMILTDSGSIREVILFPHLRPLSEEE